MRTPPRVTFCKRRGTLLNKLSQLCRSTGARAAVIVLSSTGRLYFSGGSSVEEMEEISFDYVRRNGGAMPPMGPKEGWGWVKKQRQRTEIAEIAGQVQLRRAFSNRLLTIFKMTSELCTVTDARAAVVVFSHTGFRHLFGNSSFEDVISDWVEKQRDSCKTEEDFGSLNLKYEAVLRYVREKLKDISGSGNSGVGAGCDSEVLNDDDIDSRAQSFEASHPVLFPDLKDHGLLTSPVNSAVASGSSGKEPTRSVPVGCEFNPHSSLNLSEDNPSVKAGAGGVSGVGVGHDDEVLYDDDDDWILSLPQIFEAACPSLLADFGNCNRNGDSDSFSTSPVNLAVAGGSSGVEPTPMSSDLGDCESDPNKYLNLSEDFVRDGFLKCEAVLHCVMREKLKDISGSGNSGVGAGCDSEVLNDDDIDSVLQSFKASHPVLFPDLKDHVRDDFLTSAVNSAVASGSSGKEPMRSVFVGCEFNPHSSLNLSENNPSVNAGAGGHSGVGVGHSYVVLSDDEANLIRSLLAGNGNFDRNGGSDSFLTSPVNLAVAGGSLGVESASTRSDLESGEFVDSWFDFSSGLDENDCLIPPENSTVHGGSSGEEQGYGYNPDIFSTLEDLDVSLEI